VNADVGARADRRHRLRLGEDLGVGADADLEVLRPQALGLQHSLTRAASAEPGCTLRRLSPMMPATLRARARRAPDRRAPAPR
jgi:hypothetical protein